MYPRIDGNVISSMVAEYDLAIPTEYNKIRLTEGDAKGTLKDVTLASVLETLVRTSMWSLGFKLVIPASRFVASKAATATGIGSVYSQVLSCLGLLVLNHLRRVNSFKNGPTIVLASYMYFGAGAPAAVFP